MDIAFSFLKFFDIVHKQNAFYDPVIAFGYLNMNESDKFVYSVEC